MRALVRWAIENTPGVNVMVAGILIAGLASFFGLRREVFPEFELEVILVTIPYPGASPGDTEKGVCQPVEEAVRALDGIKRLVSIAREGGGYVLVELNSTRQRRTEVGYRNSVSGRPYYQLSRRLSEDPQVEQITFREAAIKLAVLGPVSDDPNAELRLRDVAEDMRSRLLEIATISQANIQGAKPFQIDVELSEDTLRKHGLTLGTVAQIVRRENIELPGGQLRAEGQEILLRGKNRRELGREIEELPIISQPNGAVLRIGDIGTVRDEFDDSTTVNGSQRATRPGYQHRSHER